MGDTTDHDLEHAKALYNRACWEFMDSMRKGRRNDAWLDLANAIFLLWPEVDQAKSLLAEKSPER